MEQKRFAIIGFPLKHSFSPFIHNRAFHDLKLNARYEKIEITPQNFEKDILSLKKSSLAGFNVTIPFKEKILPFVDSLSAEAQKIGAVNTIKAVEGRWHGFNTDWLGFLKPIEQEAEHIKSCLLLGAGGAARGVLFALLQFPAIQTILIANRTKQRANDLKKSFGFNRSTQISTISLKELEALAKPFDLIVNTTSVGMTDHQADPLINPEHFAHSNTIVYDLIYNPLKTILLQQAEVLGLKTINGLPMLIFQAEEAFKIWTGLSYPPQTIQFLLDELPRKIS